MKWWLTPREIPNRLLSWVLMGQGILFLVANGPWFITAWGAVNLLMGLLVYPLDDDDNQGGGSSPARRPQGPHDFDLWG